MKEYIEREEAIFEFETNGSNFVYGKKACNAIISRLKAIPAADVVEVKHGRWIYNNMGGWKCSECNNQAPFWCMASTQNLSDYCPNCGAKMDGGEDDEAD